MNRQFNITRFAKIFVYEHKSSNYLRYTIPLTLLYYIAITLYGTFFSNSVVTERIAPFPLKTAILLGYISVAFYYPLFNRSKRESYISLPASNLEKYLSLFANTLIVIPAIYIILHISSLSLLQGEFIIPQHVTNLTQLCNRALITSSITCICLPSANKRSLAWGIILLLAYFFSGNMRREFGETEHICFNLLTITILQILIYYKIKNIK